MRRLPPDNRRPFRKQHRQLRIDGPYGPFLRRVVPHENARIIQAIGIAWIVSIAHAARIFQAIQIIRTMRTIHTVQTIEIALTDLFILGLQHGASRTFDPWFAFRHKSCDCRLRHARRCGDDDLRVRRFDAQVHVFDGFTHDGHRHSSDLRGFFG